MMRRKFSREFKIEAVRPVADRGWQLPQPFQCRWWRQLREIP